MQTCKARATYAAKPWRFDTAISSGHAQTRRATCHTHTVIAAHALHRRWRTLTSASRATSPLPLRAATRRLPLLHRTHTAHSAISFTHLRRHHLRTAASALSTVSLALSSCLRGHLCRVRLRHNNHLLTPYHLFSDTLASCVASYLLSIFQRMPHMTLAGMLAAGTTGRIAAAISLRSYALPWFAHCIWSRCPTPPLCSLPSRHATLVTRITHRELRRLDGAASACYTMRLCANKRLPAADRHSARRHLRAALAPAYSLPTRMRASPHNFALRQRVLQHAARHT